MELYLSFRINEHIVKFIFTFTACTHVFRIHRIIYFFASLFTVLCTTKCTLLILMIALKVDITTFSVGPTPRKWIVFPYGGEQKPEWLVLITSGSTGHRYFLTQKYFDSGLCPLSGILNTRKHKFPETGSVFVLR
jgi:hypothetical protein